jgi:hypothetical protein
MPDSAVSGAYDSAHRHAAAQVRAAEKQHDRRDGHPVPTRERDRDRAARIPLASAGSPRDAIHGAAGARRRDRRRRAAHRNRYRYGEEDPGKDGGSFRLRSAHAGHSVRWSRHPVKDD